MGCGCNGSSRKMRETATPPPPKAALPKRLQIKARTTTTQPHAAATRR